MPRTHSEPGRSLVDGNDTPFGVAYYRVSTSEQANTSFDEDGFSIQAQRDYCQRKAAELGVQLVDEYVDRGKSARTTDRPALQALLARVTEDADIQYVFVHKLDRLARNRQDDVQIGLLLAKHRVRLVSCTENIDDSPSGRLVHGIMADIAEWYSANLSEEAKKGQRKKAESGGTPGNVPVGYVNARLRITDLGKDIGVVQLDEACAPIITECFNRYDTGLCTIADVAAYANDQGLRLRATRRLPARPVTGKHMQRLLRNRYYAGWVRFGGVEYRGDHPPLIDAATFDRVQALLSARDANKDKSRKRPHHLKGTLCCARCGRRLGITVATKRGIGAAYPYFYCLGRQVDKNNCSQGYTAVSAIEDAVRAYWARVRIPEDRIRSLRRAILENFSGKHAQSKVEIEKQRRRLREFERRRQKAKAAYYADVLDLSEFKAEQEAITHGMRAAEEIIAHWSVELESITRALDNALRLMADPQALYDAVPEGLKPLLVQTVFETIWILDHQVAGSKLTAPFAALLTLDARLALAERRTTATIRGADGGMDSGATYHRRRILPEVVRHTTSVQSGWLTVERPHGSLTVDKQNPGVPGGRGSKIDHVVGLARLNLNPHLARYLRGLPGTYAKPATPTHAPSSYHRPRRWRIRDRLSEQDIAALIVAFKAGTPKRVLAQRYGIAERSLKQLLRERGVKRRSRWDIQS